MISTISLELMVAKYDRTLDELGISDGYIHRCVLAKFFMVRPPADVSIWLDKCITSISITNPWNTTVKNLEPPITLE